MGLQDPVSSQVTRMKEKTCKPTRGSGQPRGPGVATFGVLAESLSQGTGLPSWRAVWPGYVSKVVLLIHGSNFICLLPSLVPVLWSSRHAGALGLLSQGPRVSGKNRSLEEQSRKPEQALNIISSSLNRIGTGAEGSAEPPSGSQLSRPGAHLDGLLAPQAASKFLLVKAGTLVLASRKSLEVPVAPPGEASQVKSPVH